MIRYPKEFKELVLKRLLPPNAESVKRFAKEAGVSHQTLRNWMQGTHIHDLVQSLPPEPPASLNTSEKFRIVVETLSMSEDELSDYARKTGLYVTQIKEWRDICINANATDDAQKRSMQKELKAVQKENNELIVLAKDNNSISPSPFMERECPQSGLGRLLPLAQREGSRGG